MMNKTKVMKKTNSNYVRLGKEIRKLRLERGIGTRELVDKLGVSGTLITQIENYDKYGRKCSSKQLHDICWVLGVKEDRLFEMVGEVSYGVIEVLERRKVVRELVRLVKDLDDGEVEDVIE
jgi:transcriptional regulator with XRE-family HTH domain